MTFPPLGSYEQFRQQPPDGFPWGPEGKWTVSYGEGVLPHLVAGLEAFSDHRSRHDELVAIGCVPFLTSSSVVGPLLTYEGVCVVIDKQSRPSSAALTLARDGRPVSSACLPGFDALGVLDERGQRPYIGPTSGEPDPVLLGPLRVAGWRADDHGRPRPMLHAKMLVLGTARWLEDEVLGESYRLTPRRTWLGSANWTAAAPRHLEFGVWCEEPALVARNFDFLLDVLRFSEHPTAETVGPEPEFVEAEWAPDAEFAAYLDDVELRGVGEGEDDRS